MYTAREQEELRAQIRRRLLCAAAPAALLLGLIVWSFIARIQWLSVGLTIVLGCACLFGWGLLLAPLRAYDKFLSDMLGGHTRVTAGRFLHADKTPVVRDGVRFYPLMITVGNENDRKDDRLFYWDIEKPMPDFTPGQPLTVTAHDNEIAAWESAPGPS